MTYNEFSIPKKGGKLRKIVAPDAELKAFLREQLPIIEDYYLKYSKMYGVHNLIHGFVHKKNVKTAASMHVGFDMTIMMDISEFFDSVTPAHLPRISQITSEMFHKEGYTAQGFPTSPMLANIAIVPIVSKIKHSLSKLLGNQRFAFTIYADDIQISLNNIHTEHIAEIIKIVTNSFESRDFKLNKRKTRVKYAKFGYRRILGINVGNDHLTATRATRRKMRAAKHQGNGPSLGGLTTWATHISS